MRPASPIGLEPTASNAFSAADHAATFVVDPPDMPIIIGPCNLASRVKLPGACPNTRNGLKLQEI
jgi:hypothetical protein